jgi:tRNA A-37 threonylcarbamoyl transferase component Bud32
MEMTLTVTNASQGDEASLALAMTYLNTNADGAAIMQQAAANNVTITFNHVRNDSYDPDTNTIFWDPHAAITVNAFTTNMGAVDTTTTGVHSAALNLLHEAAHATDPNLAAHTNTPDPLYGNEAEKYAAEKENIVGGGLGEVQRLNHDGSYVSTVNSTEHTSTTNDGAQWLQREPDGTTSVQGVFQPGTYPSAAPSSGDSGGGILTIDGPAIVIGPGGPNRVIDVEATNATVTDDHASINLAPGASATVVGGSDTVNVGSGSSLTITGNNNALTLQNNSAVNLSGIGESVSGSGAAVTLGANSTATFAGGGNVINATQGDVITEDNAVINVAQGATVTITGIGDTVVAAGNNTIDLAGAGNTVNLTGADNFVELFGSGSGNTVNGDIATDNVYLTDNASASVNGSGGEVVLDGTGATLNASNQTVWAIDNATGETINGSGNDIHTSGGFNGNVTGGNDTVNFNGAGNFVELSGNANTVHGDVATDNVYLTSNTAASVDGSGGEVVLYGSGASLNASNQTIWTIDHATGETIAGSGNDIHTSGGFSGNVTGGNDTVSFNGAGNFVELSGNANTVHGDVATDNVYLTSNTAASVDGSGGEVVLYGSGASLNASNQTIWTIDNATAETINGSGNDIHTSSGFSGNVTGGNDTVNFNGANNFVELSGNANTVHGDIASDNVYLTSNTAAAVDGSGGEVVLYGTGDALTASNQTIWTIDHATGETIAGSGNDIHTGTGFSGNVTGGNDTVSFNGAGNFVELSGSANTVHGDVATDNVYLTSNTAASVDGSGGEVVLYGSGASLNASNQTIWTIDHATGETIAGSGNDIHTSGGFSGNVTGGNDTVSFNGAGNFVELSDNANTVHGDIASDNVYLTSNAAASVTGSGGEVVLYGTGASLTASNQTIWTIDHATAETINGSGNDIHTGIGFHGDVVGGGDTVTLAGGTANVLELHGNNSQTDIVNNDITGDEVTLVGSMTAEVRGNNGHITLTDSHETLSTNNESIGGGSNLTGEIINGISDTINVGTGFVAEIAGANDSVIANNSHIQLVTGDSNDQIHGDNDIIAAQAQVTDSIFGHNDDFNGRVGDYNGEFDAGSTGSDQWPDWGTGGDGDGGGDPIVLNLEGGKVQTQALANSTAFFDMQNNGERVHTGWVTSGEGLLVYDPDGSNSVTGDRDLVAGFGALNSLAQQVDGASSDALSASDALWSKLKVWVDSTGTGDFHSDQLYTLGQLGISSINLNAASVQSNSNGNTILADSSFTRSDGTSGDIAGVALRFAPAPVASTTLAAQSQQLISAMAGFAAPGGAALPMIAGNQNSLPITLAAGQR